MNSMSSCFQQKHEYMLRLCDPKPGEASQISQMQNFTTFKIFVEDPSVCDMAKKRSWKAQETLWEELYASFIIR